MPDHIEDDPPSAHLAGDLSPQTLEQLKRIEQATVRLAQAMQTTDRFVKRTRNIAVATGVAAVLALVGAGISIAAQQQSDEAKTLAEFGQQYDRTSCDRGNATRAAQRKQWLDARNLIVKLARGDAATVKFADALVAQANQNFPAIDCATLTGTR